MKQINVVIANKQRHDKHKDQLRLPQACGQNAKRTEKHIDEEQGKTKHEAPRSGNCRATQNKKTSGPPQSLKKKNTKDTARERSVA